MLDDEIIQRNTTWCQEYLSYWKQIGAWWFDLNLIYHIKLQCVETTQGNPVAGNADRKSAEEFNISHGLINDNNHISGEE